VAFLPATKYVSFIGNPCNDFYGAKGVFILVRCEIIIFREITKVKIEMQNKHNDPENLLAWK
jgi:hypothetical protein